jgi:hypothetical protein
MTSRTEDEPSIEHRQLSAIAAAMRRLSHDGGDAPKPVRRHRASRSVQLSLKVSAGVKEQFTAVAAAHGLAFASAQPVFRAWDGRDSVPMTGAGSRQGCNDAATEISARLVAEKWPVD